MSECCNQGKINYLKDNATMESKTMTDRDKVTSQNQNEDGYPYTRGRSRNRKNDMKNNKQKYLTEIFEISIGKGESCESPLARGRSRNKKKIGRQTKDNTSSS